MFVKGLSQDITNFDQSMLWAPIFLQCKKDNGNDYLESVAYINRYVCKNDKPFKIKGQKKTRNWNITTCKCAPLQSKLLKIKHF